MDMTVPPGSLSAPFAAHMMCALFLLNESCFSLIGNPIPYLTIIPPPQ